MRKLGCPYIECHEKPVPDLLGQHLPSCCCSWAIPQSSDCVAVLRAPRRRATAGGGSGASEASVARWFVRWLQSLPRSPPECHGGLPPGRGRRTSLFCVLECRSNYFAAAPVSLQSCPTVATKIVERNAKFWLISPLACHEDSGLPAKCQAIGWIDERRIPTRFADLEGLGPIHLLAEIRKNPVVAAAVLPHRNDSFPIWLVNAESSAAPYPRSGRSLPRLGLRRNGFRSQRGLQSFRPGPVSWFLCCNPCRCLPTMCRR